MFQNRALSLSRAAAVQEAKEKESKEVSKPPSAALVAATEPFTVSLARARSAGQKLSSADQLTPEKVRAQYFQKGGKHSSTANSSILEGPLASLLDHQARQPVPIGRTVAQYHAGSAESVHARASNWNLMAIQAKLQTIEGGTAKRWLNSVGAVLALAAVLSLTLTSIFLAVLPSSAFATPPTNRSALSASVDFLVPLLSTVGSALSWGSISSFLFETQVSIGMIDGRAVLSAVSSFFSSLRPLLFHLFASLLSCVYFVMFHPILFLSFLAVVYCLLLPILRWRIIPRWIRIYYVCLTVLFTYRRLKSIDRWVAWWHRKRRSESELATDSEARWNAAHLRLAEFVFTHIVDLGAFWVKAGQYLSSRADVMPDEFIARLSQLQDHSKAAPFSYIESVILEEFGSPVEDLFLSFNRAPLACASIAQVHEAILKDSRHVVVKVRNPRVEWLIPSDFNHMLKIMRLVAWLEPEFDFSSVIEEWTREMLKELNFILEAANQERVRKYMKQLNLDVIVPRAVPHLVKERILVMEYIEGFKITDTEKLDEFGVDRLALLKRVTQAMAAQIYYFGFFSGDCHPGNLLVQIRDGRAIPVLLDFGLTKELRPHIKLAFSRMVASVAELDFAGLLNAFDEMGLKRRRDEPLEDMRHLQFALRNTAPPEEAKEQNRKFHEKLQEKRQQQPKHLRNPIESWPPELVFFLRTSLLLRGLCSKLRVKMPFLEVLSNYAKLSILHSIPRSLHANSLIYPSNSLSSIDVSIRTLLERAYSEGSFLGCQICIYHRGKRVVDLAAGVRGRLDPRPVEPSTLFNAFGLTSTVTATALHMLVDNRIPYDSAKPRQELSYNRKVSHYWPEFAANGKDRLTISQVLSHQAGLQNAITTQIPLVDLCDFQKMCKLIENAAPAMPIKAAHHYLSYGFIVGGLINRVTGRAIGDIIRDDIAKPLNVASEFYVGVPEAEQGRIAQLANGFGRNGKPPSEDELQEFRKLIKESHQRRRFSSADQQSAEEDDSEIDLTASPQGHLTVVDPLMFNLPLVRKASIPSANGHFSARALAKFVAALTNDGTVDGARLLSPGIAMKLFSEVESRASLELPFGAGQTEVQFGKGVRVFNVKNSVSKAFGESALGGSLLFAHPQSGTSMVVLVNQLTFDRRLASQILDLTLKHIGIELSDSGIEQLDATYL